MTTNADSKTPGAEPVEQEHEFPKIEGEDFGFFHIDKKNNTFWCGLRIDRMDFNGAQAFLDSMKFNLWQVYVQLAQTLRMRHQLQQKPSGLEGLLKKTGLK